MAGPNDNLGSACVPPCHTHQVRFGWTDDSCLRYRQSCLTIGVRRGVSKEVGRPLCGGATPETAVRLFQGYGRFRGGLPTGHKRVRHGGLG
jgi:hypothetical protein